MVRFPLGRRGGTDLSSPDSLPYTRNSPYVAVCLATFLGARRIGLVGVDFTDHHFFADTGRHPLARELARIDREYGHLGTALAESGVELVNLSPTSRLGVLPKVDATRWLAGDSSSGKPGPPGQVRNRLALSVYVQTRRGVVQGGLDPVARCLDTLAATAAACGCSVSRSLSAPRDRPDILSIVWNGRSHRSRGPVLYCEHGWLPRTDYQISPRGINADSHVALGTWTERSLSEEDTEALELHLDALRRAEGTGPAPPGPEPPGLPGEFLLVPLQMEGDTNLVRHAPRALRRMQGLVDLVSSADPPWPLVFKQHPADLRRVPRHLRLRLRRRQDLLFPHEQGNVHRLLATGRCRGIVSVNSNVVHDGLLWGVPAVALGEGVWPRSGPGPFLRRLPADWRELAHHLEDPQVVHVRATYAAYLVRHQWTAEALHDRETVRELLESAVPTRSVRTRRQTAARRHLRPVARPLTINVVARNRGWLFEDLKRHFTAATEGEYRVVASERPVRAADRWIFLRTHEAAASPDPRRTLVQIHDLFDHGLYRPGKARYRAIHRSGAIVLTHPDERGILDANGLSIEDRKVLCRPLGALSAFSLREELPEPFTIGWVGRPVVHRGRDLKRVGWLVDAVRRAELDTGSLRVLLVGERLEETAQALEQAGIATRYHHRRKTPIEQYPELYRQLDVLVVTSLLAAGPNSLFEALATGVPVVSTRVGWALELLRPGETGYLVDSVDELAGRLTDLQSDREAWFNRRETIRKSLGGYTLESWVSENLATAAALCS